MNSVSLKQRFERAFRGFDVNNLDVSEAWSWPYGVRAIVFALLFIIIGGVGFKFLVMDQKESLDKEVGREQTLKTQFEAKSYQVASLDALRRQMADVELRFAEMLAQLPTEKEVPGLLEDISATGRNAGLEIDSIALQPERKPRSMLSCQSLFRLRVPTIRWGSLCRVWLALSVLSPCMILILARQMVIY